MRDDAEAPKPSNVLRHVSGIPAEAIGRGGHVDREIVPARRADLDAVEHEHSGSVLRRLGRSDTVAVIRDDDELQPGTSRGGGDFVDRAGAIRARGVNVDRAGGHARVVAGSRERDARWRKEGQDRRGGREGHRGAANYNPASARSALALSVRSHVNSGSVRPKCPNAAVFL
jgi:hypothetical protein